MTHLNQLQALVIVEHENDQFNLYLSGLEGILFSLSLPDLVVQYGVGMDLEVVRVGGRRVGRRVGIPYERASQGEQNDANFSSIAPSPVE